MANLSGAAGCALIGWAAGRFALKPLAFCAILGAGLGTIGFGFAGPGLVGLTLAASVAGFFAHTGMVAIHSLIARTFPTRMRATGAGFALGVGRIGSAIAPASAGYLFNAGMSRSGVCLVLGASAVIGAGLLLSFHVRRAGLAEEPTTELGAVVPAL